MGRFWILFISATLAAASLAAQTSHRLGAGLEFQTPPDWRIKAGPQGAVLLPPQAAGDEIYLIAMLGAGYDVRDPKTAALIKSKLLPNAAVRRDATPLSFASGRGFLHSFQAADNSPFRIDLYLVALPSGASAAIIAGGDAHLVVARRQMLAAVGSTFSTGSAATALTTPQPTSSGALAWTERLRGKKLVKLSGYSSGTAGGYSGRRTLILAADGSYSYRSSMAIAVYTDGNSGTSTGRNNHSGRWRVSERGGRAFLETHSDSGEVMSMSLSFQSGKTLLNGERWFLVGINE